MLDSYVVANLSLHSLIQLQYFSFSYMRVSRQHHYISKTNLNYLTLNM